MKHRIRRIGVLKAAIIGGIAYAIMSLVFVPVFLLMIFVSGPMMNDMGGPERMIGPAFMLLAPLIYGVLGFIGTAIAALVYNLIAMMVGGLEIELERLDPAFPPPSTIT